MSVVTGSFTLEGGRGGSTAVPFFVLFRLHYPKILRAQLKTCEDCQSKLGLFTLSKNPLNAVEDAESLTHSPDQSITIT